MLKGMLQGLLMQCMSAIGYLMLVGVPSIRSKWFRTSLMILSTFILLVADDVKYIF